MATNLRTPGVYVQEITTLSASIAGVDTAIPAFVGYVQKAERNGGEGIPMFTPVRIASFLEYESIFGGPDPQGFNINVADVSVGGNVTRTVSVDKTLIDESIFRMYYNLSMYFSNGGGPCWIVPVGLYATASPIKKTDFTNGLKALEKESEPTLLLFPDALSLTEDDIKDVNDAAIDQCSRLKNRFTIMDVKQSGSNTPLDDADDFRNDMVGIDALKYAAAYYPYLNTTMNFGISQLLLQVTGYTLTIAGVITATDFDLTKKFNGFVSESVQGTLSALNYLKVATKTLTVDDADKVKQIITDIRSSADGARATAALPAFPTTFNAAGDLIDDIVAISPPDSTNGVLKETEDLADIFDDTNGQTITNANALKIALTSLLDALNQVMDEITDAYNDVSTDFIGGNLNYLQNNRPSIYSEIISAINGYRVTINPSGTMAGIYARVDNSKGVWQAPANVGVRNVIGPAVLVTNEQQGSFNIDSLSGKSINVIRNFTGRGTVVWGARTLDGNSNEWRYVNVRRLFIYLEESIKRASQAVVFEPNDANTWVRTKGMIRNFLTDVWRNGGLVGATAEEAFFVNVGVGTSMTTLDVLEGRMIIEIGVAAVRPAEFIILRFTHFVQE
jgi:uncharacterized protein